MALISLAGPVGLIVAGPLADRIGFATLFVVAGAGSLLCWLLNWLFPAARQYDQTLQQDELEK
jgi:DHA3 family macrolide efflux protein-like MFS transporter